MALRIGRDDGNGDSAAAQRNSNKANVVVRIDASELMNTMNNNPHTYEFKFATQLRDITSISLSRSSLVRSPVITLVRSSDWIPDSTPLGSTDNFHQLADRMKFAIGNADATTYVATISNPYNTVYLKVHDVYTRTATRGDSYMKTYDVLTCTGYVMSSDYSDWTITAEGETPNTEITPSDDNALLSVNINPQPAILRILPNGNRTQGRLSDPFAVYPAWRSYTMYYAGDTVDYRNTRYMCTTTHLSVTFAGDTLFWNQYSTLAATSAADDAFEVFYFSGDGQTTDVQTYNSRAVRWDVNITALSSISIEWRTLFGRRFIFPYNPLLRCITLDSATDYTNEREYQAPVIHLEIECAKL